MSKILDKEQDFHDSWAESININEVLVDEFFQACTSPENRIILEKLGDISQKNILELGCGAGEASVFFAKMGAKVIATDISNQMLEVVKKVAKKHLVHIDTKKCYSHNLPFNSETFDIVYAANLLHHVDIEETLVEVRRVLKSGGIFVTWDPLDHNPLIKIYRRKASEVRTEDEHPIKWKQLRLFEKYFNLISINTTWFFTLWIFIKFYLIDKINPNEERYWKKIIIDHKKLEKTYYRLEKIDKLFIKIFPFLKKFCWNIVLILQK